MAAKPTLANGFLLIPAYAARQLRNGRSLTNVRMEVEAMLRVLNLGDGAQSILLLLMSVAVKSRSEFVQTIRSCSVPLLMLGL